MRVRRASQDASASRIGTSALRTRVKRQHLHILLRSPGCACHRHGFRALDVLGLKIEKPQIGPIVAAAAQLVVAVVSRILKRPKKWPSGLFPKDIKKPATSRLSVVPKVVLQSLTVLSGGPRSLLRGEG